MTKTVKKFFFFSVPSQAPINVTTKPLNSTSFSVTWQQVPPDHVHGIVLGYKVLLENMADGSLLFTETVNVNQTQITLNGSREVSTFCVRVLAFTRKGDGKASTCTEAWTWSEGRCLMIVTGYLVVHSLPNLYPFLLFLSASLVSDS